MRILVVTDCVPWPQDAGTRIRFANMIAALARVGDIDLFALCNQGSARSSPPVDFPVVRFEQAVRPESGFSAIRRIPWLACGRLPSKFVGRDYSGVQAKLRAWAAESYDLVWFGHTESYVAAGSLADSRTIVDIDDLEDQKILWRLRAMAGDDTVSARERFHRRAVILQATKNARLWRSLQQRIASSVDAAIVCSPLDRARLAAPSVFVVPNGYEAPEASAGRDGVGSPPTVLFQGLLTYPPNADGARWLVEEVASLLRSRVPGIRIRLVGRAGEDVRRLQDPPQVVVTGPVPGMSAELARVDLVAVPIRIGSGTRIKILEAFAHRIPVVSTTTGAEGLDVVDGRHLLIADSREAFAAACFELLSDQVRRATIIDEAHRLFMERYQWDHIRKRVVALAAGVVQGGTVAAEVTLPIGEHGRVG